MTGSAVGPLGSSYAVKIAIAKYATVEICKHLHFKALGNSIVGKKFLRQIDNVDSTAACGFSSLAGMARRPILQDETLITQSLGYAGLLREDP